MRCFRDSNNTVSKWTTNRSDRIGVLFFFARETRLGKRTVHNRTHDTNLIRSFRTQTAVIESAPPPLIALVLIAAYDLPRRFFAEFD